MSIDTMVGKFAEAYSFYLNAPSNSGTRSRIKRNALAGAANSVFPQAPDYLRAFVEAAKSGTKMDEWSEEAKIGKALSLSMAKVVRRSDRLSVNGNGNQTEWKTMYQRVLENFAIVPHDRVFATAFGVSDDEIVAERTNWSQEKGFGFIDSEKGLSKFVTPRKRRASRKPRLTKEEIDTLKKIAAALG